MTLEGGVAFNVPKIGGAFGHGLLPAEQISDDSGTDVPLVSLRALNLYGQNRLFGIGPDVTMAVFQHGGTIGLVTARFLGIGWEELIPRQHFPYWVHHCHAQGEVSRTSIRPDPHEPSVRDADQQDGCSY